MMTADMRAQFLRSQGFLVIKVDNRGSDRRGLAFEAAIQGKLGSLEVDDQVAAVKYAIGAGLADPARVGIYGWSYGGYLSAMCLAKAPDVFRCAVSGAPVTSWDGCAPPSHLKPRTSGWRRWMVHFTPRPARAAVARLPASAPIGACIVLPNL
jgi:dienelactone hydrolase